jgi:hypothetical protein
MWRAINWLLAVPELFIQALQDLPWYTIRYGGNATAGKTFLLKRESLYPYSNESG